MVYYNIKKLSGKKYSVLNFGMLLFEAEHYVIPFLFIFYEMANMFPGHFIASYGFFRAKVKNSKNPRWPPAANLRKIYF